MRILRFRHGIAMEVIPVKDNIRVLCLSRDHRLLQTRQMVLASRYSAIAVGNVAELSALPADLHLDVVLLCHTLSKDESELAARIARERWPGVRILTLSAERSNPSTYADGTIRGLDGPRRLLQAIDGLVRAHP